MKTIIHLLGITPKEVGEDACRQLCEIYPEGDRSRGSGSRFTCKLSDDDPRMKKLLQVLQQHGATPWGGFTKKKPDEFWMRLERVYDSVDYEAASYFVPHPRVKFGDLRVSRTESGLLELRRRSVSLVSQIAWGWRFVIISDTLMQQMEQARLQHLVFREVQSPGRTPNRFHGHVWELTSDMLLPALSPQCRLINNDGEPFDGDYNKGCFFKEGNYYRPEMHYLTADLQQAGTFDLALTRERFGIRDHVAYHELVASKRFYEFCTAHKLRMNWTPVRVDFAEEMIA